MSADRVVIISNKCLSGDAQNGVFVVARVKHHKSMRDGSTSYVADATLETYETRDGGPTVKILTLGQGYACHRIEECARFAPKRLAFLSTDPTICDICARLVAQVCETAKEVRS